MIERRKQKIISWFGLRIREGKEEFHPGVDFRSWKFKHWKRQPVVFPEKCVFLRRWRDKWGGGCAYKGLESGYVFKSMHIRVEKDLRKKAIYEKGEIIGYSEPVPDIDEHEHFEVLIKDTIGFSKKYQNNHRDEFWINPIQYMIKENYAYK